MPAVFANPYASRSQHISSQKIAQLRLKVKPEHYRHIGRFSDFVFYQIKILQTPFKNIFVNFPVIFVSAADSAINISCIPSDLKNGQYPPYCAIVVIESLISSQDK